MGGVSCFVRVVSTSLMPPLGLTLQGARLFVGVRLPFNCDICLAPQFLHGQRPEEDFVHFVIASHPGDKTRLTF